MTEQFSNEPISPLYESGCCLCGVTKFSPSLAFGGPLKIGALCDGRENPGAVVCANCCRGGGDGWDVADKEITRRRAALAAPKKAEEFYGEQPEVLPETLSPGICDGDSHELVHLVRKPDTRPWYVCENGFECCRTSANELPWERIPKQAAATPSPPAPQPTCPGEGGYACSCANCSKPPEPKRDPYAEHLYELQDRCGMALPAKEMDGHIAAMMAQHDAEAFMQLSPAERRKRQAMQQLSRPLPSAHPVSWPSDCDSEELYVS